MKKFIIKASIPFLMIAAFSCATTQRPGGHLYMRQGTMISLADGSEMPLEVQGTDSAIYNEGVMLAANPANGETFRGKYYHIDEGTTSIGKIQNKWGTSTGKITTTSENRHLRGVLKGSQGSVLNVDILVGAANSNYHGEASDAKGGKYQIILSPHYISRKLQ